MRAASGGFISEGPHVRAPVSRRSSLCRAATISPCLNGLNNIRLKLMVSIQGACRASIYLYMRHATQRRAGPTSYTWLSCVTQDRCVRNLNWASVFPVRATVCKPGDVGDSRCRVLTFRVVSKCVARCDPQFSFESPTEDRPCFSSSLSFLEEDARYFRRGVSFRNGEVFTVLSWIVETCSVVYIGIYQPPSFRSLPGARSASPRESASLIQ